MPRGGWLSVSTRTQGASLVVEVGDTGSGIPTEHLSRIYDPFFTTDLQAHIGLGMHILYNLVTRKLNGEVECHSDPNHGVHFRLTFPLSPEPDPADPPIPVVTVRV